MKINNPCWMPIATAPEHKEIIVCNKKKGIFLGINTTIDKMCFSSFEDHWNYYELKNKNHWYYGSTQGNGLLKTEEYPTLWINFD